MAQPEAPSTMAPKEQKSYLGFDFSTQQVKAIVVSEGQEVLQEAAVQFDNDLPEYRTHGGVHVRGDDQCTVTAPAIMWVKALDMLMDKLRVAGADFTTIAAISGTAQQHGSVYWRTGASKTLENLQPDRFLHEQLSQAFCVPDSPVWMDSSTSEQCQRLEEAVGGPQKLAEITGSRAYQRFTGPQIAKIHQKRVEAYNNTERISLVSSFACSLLLGSYAPIDFADASGMNLLDIKTKTWSQPCLDANVTFLPHQACAPGLAEKLGAPVASAERVGVIAGYFVDRYSFDPECAVVAFTGDNPASLAGMCVGQGDVVVSLGTSDTVILWPSDPPAPQLEGHVLVNPVDSAAFMVLLCFKNGSFTREKIRDECADGAWDLFNELLDMTPRGNFGNMGMYYHLKEIIPELEGVFRFNKAGEAVGRFASREVEVRSVIESQFIAKRMYAEKLGYSLGGEGRRVLATGGASGNSSILQVLADVFNCPVYTMVGISFTVYTMVGISFTVYTMVGISFTVYTMVGISFTVYTMVGISFTVYTMVGISFTVYTMVGISFTVYTMVGISFTVYTMVGISFTVYTMVGISFTVYTMVGISFTVYTMVGISFTVYTMVGISFTVYTMVGISFTVYTMEVSNSACLGSAYRAKHGLVGGQYLEAITSQPFTLACNPNADADKIYTPMVKRFQSFEAAILANKK
ncbi:Xylulose kinase [Chionoecetes opilio]|uniref:Xylulose kinase n=1 Tax=Chionoecetes opilio TaxID=41210 RepID=A0A8J5CM30_CHIOP|nr:Xylulose kinase [Chionoecetes opilio]